MEVIIVAFIVLAPVALIVVDGMRQDRRFRRSSKPEEWIEWTQLLGQKVRVCNLCRRTLPNDGSCSVCGPIQQSERKAEEQRRCEAAERDRAEQEREERRKRAAAELKTLDGLRSLDPFEFEKVVAQLFRRMGYEVRQTPPTGDGGFDAVAMKDGAKYLIECKKYARETLVGRRDVQILHSAAVDQDAEAFLVTTSQFAATARRYAGGKGIKLIAGAELVRLLERHPD